jgi:hypothetical protein
MALAVDEGLNTDAGALTTPDKTSSGDTWRPQIEAARKKRDKFVTGVWQTNVAFRVQKPFSQGSDDDADQSGVDQIAVPADWSRTRSKTTALFSRIPRVSLAAAHQRYAVAVPTFEKIVNHFTPLSGIEACFEEMGADVVNAAGVCAAIMKYEATFEMVDVPAVDVRGLPPDQVQQGIAMGLIPMKQAPQTVSERYRCYRISPAQLLWPTEFSGSDWQRARWLGYDGVLPWAQAVTEFKLTEADKEDCCTSAGTDATSKTLAGDVTREVTAGDEQVRYAEIFYWAALCEPEEKRFDAIRRMVFVHGKDEPVIDEPYSGQRWVPETRQFVGCTRLPVEVQTLTYVSDKAIPPSDSEIGRPMVLEQSRSRSQMIMQRTRNLPIRTADVNRVDPTILDLLMRGTWQGIIPTNGPGDRIISQVAAAAFPREDFTFDQVSNRDLDDAWSMSPNQMGNYASGERSASEANIIQGAYASVLGYQRNKMVNLFLGLIDTLMGLLQLNLDSWEAEPIVGPDGVQKLEQWDRTKIAGKFLATVRQDATVLQDTQARVNQLMKFLNIAGKSGRIAIDPILAELAALSGLDPATVMLPPAQPKAEPPNVSFRFSGWQDLHDPLTLATYIKANPSAAPGPNEMEMSKLMIADSLMPAKSQIPQAPQGPLPEGPGQGQQLMLPPGQAAPPGMPPPGPEQTADRNWNAMERVSKRPFEEGG